MAASSRKHQLSLPPMPLQESEQEPSAFRKSQQESAGQSVLGNSEQGDEAFRKAQQLKSERQAAELLDEVFRDAKLRNPDIAFLCGVSESLVEKWRSVDQRGCPSLVQMLLLPPAFHVSLQRYLNKRYGYGRAALVRLLDAAGDLALVVE